MTQIPKKLDAHSPHYQMINTINQLIDYLHELTSRIDTIAGNQLEMKRGELAKDLPTEQKVERDIFGQWSKVPVDQPKRWRAEIENDYWYVEDCGEISKDYESDYSVDDFRYAIGNYHPTREAAEAYKAKLLADNAQV